MAAKPHGIASMLPVALASGIRPCTGAVLILLLTLSQGIFEIGVVATVVMSFGTFIVVALIGLGVLNALLLAGPALAKVGAMEPHAALPLRARMAAALSLAIWLSVAACGRLIAYF